MSDDAKITRVLDGEPSAPTIRPRDTLSPATALHDPTDAQLETIYRLGRDVWGANVSEEAYLEECRRSVKYRRGTWYAAMSNERPVSALIVYSEGFGLPAGCRGIGSIATATEARGRGHASRLLDDVLATLKRTGARGVFLFADADTSLYVRRGFVAAGGECGSSCLWRPFETDDETPRAPDYF